MLLAIRMATAGAFTTSTPMAKPRRLDIITPRGTTATAVMSMFTGWLTLRMTAAITSGMAVGMPIPARGPWQAVQLGPALVPQLGVL